MLVLAKAEEIKDGSVIINTEGKRLTVEAETVVLAVGAQSKNELEKMLKGKVALYTIGDCVVPRNILDAVAEGARVAREI